MTHLSNLYDTFFEGGRDHRVAAPSAAHMPYFEGVNDPPACWPSHAVCLPHTWGYLRCRPAAGCSPPPHIPTMCLWHQIPRRRSQPLQCASVADAGKGLAHCLAAGRP